MTTTLAALPPPSRRDPTLDDPFFYGWRESPTTRPDGTTASVRVPLTEWDVLHPLEGDFIVITDAHDTLLDYLKAAVRWRSPGPPAVYALADHRIDWQVPGVTPHGPDLTVLANAEPLPFGVGTYPVRDRGASVLFVVEITSPSTRRVDLEEKPREYALARIPQFVIVDLSDDDGNEAPRLLNYNAGPEGEPLGGVVEAGRVWLHVIGLWLVVEGTDVFCELPDGTRVPDYTEAANALTDERAEREEAQVRADAERQRADAERQRADAERQRADAERQRADAERREREEADRRAAAERQRAEAAEAQAADFARRLAELEAKLRGQ